VNRFSPSQQADQVDVKSGEVPCLRFYLKELGQFLKTRREGLLTFALQKNPSIKEEARGRLEALATQLQLFERLELNQSSASGRFDLILRLRTTASLRK
jgi:hypothetical protein